MGIIVAISETQDGNMYIPSDKANQEIVKNRQAFLTKNNISLSQTTRVDILYEGTNYKRYHEVTNQDTGAGMINADVTSADALITRDVNHALFLPLADCVGMVIYDPHNQILMLSHIGRHSVEENDAYESIMELLNRYGSDVRTLQVWLTPAPGIERYPLWAFNNRSFKEVVYEQIAEAGINEKNVINNTADTTTDSRYFSHSEFLGGRRQEDGRHSIVAMMTTGPATVSGQ